MPKMKWGDDFDEDALDDEEYDPDSEGGFEPYDGPIPPKDKILKGEIKKVWALMSGSGNPMFKVIFEAKGNTGELAEYNGLPIWDNVVWVPQNKWRWQPWLEAVGIPNAATVKRATVTATDDDNVGSPVMKVGKVSFANPVPVRVLTGKPDSYNDEPKATVGKWLPAKSKADAPSKPRRARGADADDDYEDDDVPF